MSKSLSRLLSLLAGALLAVGVSTPAAPAPLVIKLGTVAPEGSVWHDGLLRMRQQWREATNGQVELRIFAGGVLGSEEELVRKLQRRAIDAVALSSGGLPVLDESFQCLNVPMMFESTENLAFVRAGAGPDIERRIEQRGFKVLNWAPAGWVQIFAKQPVRTPDDLRKLRVWTSAGDADTERLYKRFGFNAVPLPATDFLTSLQTGLLDAVPTMPLFALLDRSYTVANHMTVLNWTPLNSATVISAQAWSRIPADQQPRLLALARAEGDALGARAERAGDDAIREMQGRGLKVIRLTEPERAAWRSESEKSYPVFRGQLCPADLFDQVVRLDRAYRPQP
jgi:TRAP-type C4-dicarboxylate transport system substrate-binding protein